MELKDILAKCDHTLLTQTATWAEIKGVCDDGMKYHTASVCIPASYVKQAKEYVGDKLPICTVIGFPNGYDTTAAKCFMASDAVANGADEVDMVINIGWAKDGLWEKITEEIAAVKAACNGKLLKGHHRDLPAHRRGKDRPVQVRLRLRRGLHQNLHGLFQGRRDLPRRGAVRRARCAPCEDQGRRRHFQPCRRGEVHYAGRVPSGNLPHCQDRKGIGGQRLLNPRPPTL